MSATLERRFGGVEDMHLLKGHSSIEDLLAALRSLASRRRGAPVVVDARDFYYSRIALAIGSDVLVQILDAHGNWLHVNDTAAEYLGQPRDWFPGRNLFQEMPSLLGEWDQILHSVARTRETYIDRTRRGLFFLANPTGAPPFLWSVLAFPITLHDSSAGAVLTARILERTPPAFV
jgi:PAS domain-containing protein